MQMLSILNKSERRITMNSKPILVTAAEVETGGNTIAKQNRLLVTQTVRLEKEGLNVRYAELGDPAKPPVLLLHGVPENLQGWYAVAPLLAEKYHVLALDWPGFGGSDPRTSKTSAWARSTLSRAHTSFKHPCWWCGASTIASSAASWGMRLRKSCQTPSWR